MKLAYLTSRYPTISHTFIVREVLSLRERGVDVQTFSIRRPESNEILSALDRAEYRGTFHILPVSPVRLVAAHATCFLSQPIRYLQAWWHALWRRPPGLRALIWHMFYFLEAGILAAELKRRGIRHVHVHFANVAADVAMLAAKMTDVRWSMTLHGHSDFRDPIQSRLSEKIRDSTFVACVSDHGRAQAMLSSSPGEWNKFRVTRCGVDVASFLPTTHSEEPTDRPLRLLTVARLEPEKGIDVLLDALHHLAAFGVCVHGTIVGDGTQRARLESRCRSLGLRECVRFTGAVPHDAIHDCYCNADVFVLSSFMEGLPVVLMEAMACALPVVASRITAIPELVSEGETGLLFPPGRADLLAEAVRKLADDAVARVRMGAAGRRKVTEQHDMQASGDQLHRCFREFLEPEPSTQATIAPNPKPRLAGSP